MSSIKVYCKLHIHNKSGSFNGFCRKILEDFCLKGFCFPLFIIAREVNFVCTKYILLLKKSFGPHVKSCHF